MSRWRCIANLGDRGWMDYGGFFIIIDKHGKERPRIEILEEPMEGGEQVWTVYRMDIDKCYLSMWDGKEVLSDNQFHKHLEAWFADALWQYDEQENPEERTVDLICSDDVKKRAWAYQTVVGYYGAYEFDQDPLRLSARDVLRRYRKVGLK